jgi:hypothetical protein
LELLEQQCVHLVNVIELLVEDAKMFAKGLDEHAAHFRDIHEMIGALTNTSKDAFERANTQDKVIEGVRELALALSDQLEALVNVSLHTADLVERTIEDSKPPSS